MSAFHDAMMRNRRPTDLMMTPVDWNPAALAPRQLVAPKWDGIHAGFAPGAPAYSREGSPMHCMAHLRDASHAIEAELYALTHERHRLFGEYVNPNGFDATIGDFQRGTGTGHLMLFDAPSEPAYQGRTLSRPLIERLGLLDVACQRAGADKVIFTRHTMFDGDARDAIEIVAGEMWAQGIEGIVSKDADSPYVRGQSAHWHRLKQRHTADVPIAAIETRPDGKLKALVCGLLNKVLVRVGVGFSERERTDWNKLFALGDVVQINHLGATAKGSLRSPAFSRRRVDKAAR